MREDISNHPYFDTLQDTRPMDRDKLREAYNQAHPVVFEPKESDFHPNQSFADSTFLYSLAA